MSAAPHVPVLLDEVLAAVEAGPGQHIVDGTFGAGGYTRALLAQGAQVTAFDRDPSAIAGGEDVQAASDGKLTLVQAPFSSMAAHVDHVHAVVLDIGVSSMQIDQAIRGFSFLRDGPLDMRMADTGLSAADVVNTYKSGDLARIFNFLGEERNAGRIARMIVERREKRAFETTLQLADAIQTLIGRSPRDKIHPATRVFQALRAYVNDELGELARALLAAEAILSPGGRLVVVSFHSLEDRMVKRFIADRSDAASGSRHLPQVSTLVPTFERKGGAVGPSEAEMERNPRARSAKLRAARRTAAAVRPADLEFFDLPKLPELPRQGGQ